MSNYMIQVQGLGKKYRIGNHAPYHRFTEMLSGLAASPLKLLRRPSPQPEVASSCQTAPPEPEKEFWALKDINFEINQGEVIGVIGRNGAGKSTLLKLLSRITPPTTGRIRYRGRIGSLLEVGTGFHPELSGRDNIFLNGAILGMTRSEVRRKFDQIVAFSETERFLDTAVKHYSSGMYMRLAFAVAAHLEPEILLVDEVLAVGDAEFQKKCLGKMGEVAKAGKTVIFVSHNMASIRELCTSCLLLHQGELKEAGPVSQVLATYTRAGLDKNTGQVDLTNPNLRVNSLPDSHFKWQHIELIDAQQEVSGLIGFADPLTIRLGVKLATPVNDLRLGMNVRDAMGVPIFTVFNDDQQDLFARKPGNFELDIHLPQMVLAPGNYTISLGANGPRVIDFLPTAMHFTIDADSKSSGKTWKSHWSGMVHCNATWSIR